MSFESNNYLCRGGNKPNDTSTNPSCPQNLAYHCDVARSYHCDHFFFSPWNKNWAKAPKEVKKKIVFTKQKNYSL